nr:hypothetical protein [Enterococcus sp. 665A]MBO1339868.1 hypothetical protein [Enterococcus sp. 665A]
MLKATLKTLVSLIILYVILMTTTYSIPNSALNEKIDESLSTLKYEGDYKIINTGDFGTRLDNFTDRVMIQKARKGEASPIKEGMSISDYPRYWHGYQVFLRPMLTVISYTSIRQIYLLILIIFLGLNFYLLTKRTNLLVSISLMISLTAVRFNVFSLSMQFSNVFILLLTGNVFLLTRNDAFFKGYKRYLFFLVIASLTNFFDLLTAPMITLGIPLVIVCYLMLTTVGKEKYSLLDFVKNIINCSFFWGIGYGITWISKWSVATVILKRNVVSDAINQILFRTEGDQNWPVDRVKMLGHNILLAFNKINLLFIVGFLLSVIIMILLKRKRSIKVIFEKRILVSICSFIFIASMPYLWYLILANHSQIHYWFTYRLQVITIFSIMVTFSFFYDCLCRE